MIYDVNNNNLKGNNLILDKKTNKKTPPYFICHSKNKKRKTAISPCPFL